MSEPSRVLGLPAPVDLAGRTVLVIGATAGVGAAAAQQIGEMGATLIIVGRDAAKLAATRQALEPLAEGGVHTQLADLADLASVRAAAAALSQRFEPHRHCHCQCRSARRQAARNDERRL